MVKFTKDGSTVTSAALKLARRATGRELVAICADHPFFSYDDWFICTTTSDGGIPRVVYDQTVQFRSTIGAFAQFAAHPGKIAAMLLSPPGSRSRRPSPRRAGRARHAEGGVVVFDEPSPASAGTCAARRVCTAWSPISRSSAGGQRVLAVCVGRQRDVMHWGGPTGLKRTCSCSPPPTASRSPRWRRRSRRGGLPHRPDVEHLHRVGARLAEGLRQDGARRGLTSASLRSAGRDPVLRHRDRIKSSQRSPLFLQELIKRGVLGPSSSSATRTATRTSIARSMR